MTEKQIDRRFRKIQTLKSILKKEKAKFGWFDDSYGRRYSIAELYFEIGDFRKTNIYLNWFNKNFPNDVTYPYFQLNSAFTYFKVNKLNLAYKSVVKLNCLNLFLVDLLNKKSVEEQDIPEWSESESLKWAENNYELYKQNLTEEFLDWINNISNSSEYQIVKNKYISILKLIKYAEELNQRSQLFEAKNECEKEWQEVKLITTHNN